MTKINALPSWGLPSHRLLWPPLHSILCHLPLCSSPGSFLILRNNTMYLLVHLVPVLMNISYLEEAYQHVSFKKNQSRHTGKGINKQGRGPWPGDGIWEWTEDCLGGLHHTLFLHTLSRGGLIAHGFSLHIPRLFSFLLAALTKLQEVMGNRKWTSHYYWTDERPWDPEDTTWSHYLPDKQCEPPGTLHAGRLQRLSSRGCVFCLQCTIWIDSGKRAKHVSQTTKGCSCNILPPEKHTSWIVPLRLWAASHFFCFSGMGTRVKTHGACSQRNPVLMQCPTLQPCKVLMLN